MNRILLIILALIFFNISKNYGQERTISGTVTSSEDGSPLPGVSVVIKGTVNGTNTDNQGKYSLAIANDNSILIFSFIGKTSEEVTVGTQKSIDVNLLPDIQALSEVIITGYGSQSQLTKTGAVVQVKGKDIENTPFSSLDKALQGRVAGLQSTGGSGQPGSIQNVRIRGIGSMYSTDASQPLFVVDGIPVNSGDITRATTTGNALAGINPNDIESISVLKDASASSIYGSRAANGVILITTKKGKSGKTKVRADVEYGVTKIGYLSDKNRPLNTSEWRELTAEGLVNYSPATYPDQEAALAYIDANYNTSVNTNWLKEVTRPGKQMQYNLSADGGNEMTQFRVSGGYFSQEGVVLASKFERVSTNITLTHKVDRRLSFNANLMVSNSKQKGPSNGGTFGNPILTNYLLLPSYSPRNPDGTPNISGPDFPSGGFYNPVAIADMDKGNANILKGIGSFYAEYKILENLKISSKIGVDYNNLEEDSYNNPFYGAGRNDIGHSSRYYTRYFNWIWTNLADYSIDLNNDKVWVGNIKVGYEAQKSTSYTSNVTTFGLPANMSITVPSAGSVPREAAGSNADYAFASSLAIADFSYKSRYVISGSFRRDGSSRFGTKNRYGNFWSVGASWNMEQEEFIKGLPWIEQLKIRGSYGVNGNANIGNYDWHQLYSYGTTYNYLGATGNALTQIGNPALTWEVNKPLDLGLDVAVLNNRLSFTLELYTRTTSKLLLGNPLSRTSGFTGYIDNVGSMRNRGIEFSVSGTPLKIRDFRWDASFNFSRNENKILTLVNTNQIVAAPFIRRVGENYQSFYIPLWAGVDPSNGNPLWYTDSTKTETTSTYNQAQRAIAGSASPKAFGSLGSTFSFKGFSLSGFLYYNFGNMVIDGFAAYTQSDGYNSSYNRVASQLGRWQKPGDVTNVPKYVYRGANSSNSSSSRFLYKGDYIRLRDITFGYSVPLRIISKLKVASAKIYLRGSNIWTWVKDKNIPYDPETYITSSTNFEMYIPKTYTVGINIGL